ncbi:phage tail tape measure protein [Streptomyces sp. NPDC059928]|uniref:phage tail tape measure protein n=1 Tax=unclassified Streptomyces TaxID=2593676 RepID=UPI0036506FFD
MTDVADLYAILRLETAPFTSGLRTAATEGESFTAKMGGVGAAMSKVGAATAAVGVGVAVVSVKMASDFQTQMTRLYTAAGLTQDQLKKFGTTADGLNAQVLKIGDTVGIAGTKMAEALYHPISAGLDLKSSLEVVKYAAEEAKISGASLDDTTYSLSSVMKAFNQPASQAKQTMAELNAVVGQGDMRFQDFNGSIKNWAPTAAQMGISVKSMGAGLAYLTDRGNSAEVAATRMTMGISMMTTPSKQATKMLVGMGLASTDVKASSEAMQSAMQKAGITQNKLAMDLKQPDGLYVALNDLKTSLEKAGVSGTEADSVLSKIFGGGRSDKAIMSLMQNLDGLKGKYQDIANASAPAKFDAAWQKSQQTFSAQMEKIKANAENLGIALGLKLIPVIQSVLSFFTQHKAASEALAAAIGVVLTGAVVKFVAGALSPLISAMGGAVKAVQGMRTGLSLLTQGFQDARVANSAFSGVMGTLGGKLRTAFDAAGAGLGRLKTSATSAFETLQLKGMYAWDGTKAGALRMRTAAVSALDTVRLKGMYAWEGVKSGASKAATAVTDFGSKVATATKAAGAAAWSGTVNGLRAVGTAMKTAALASLEYAKSAATAVATSVRAAAAWTAEKVALIATSVAEKAAAAAQWLLNAAMDANPIGLIVLAIAALVAALIYAYNHCKTFREIVQAVFRGVATVAMWLWHSVFEPVFHGIATVVGWVVDFIKGHWPMLLAILTGPIGIAVLLITKYWSQIKDAFSTAYHAVVGVVTDMVVFVALLPGRIIMAVASLAARLFTWATEAFTKAKDAVVSVVTSLLVWWVTLPNRILAAVSSLGSILWNWATSAFSQAWHAAVSIGGSLLSWVAGIPGRILSVLGDLGSLLWNAGANVIRGLINGINSMFGAVGHAVSGIVSDIKAHLPWSPAKKGPLSGSGAPEIGGRNITKLLAKGIDSGTGDIEAAMGRITGKARASLAVGVSGGFGGGAGALAMAGGGATAPVIYNVTVNVQGSVLSERDLRDTVQQQMLQLGARNSQTWQSYHR